MNIKPTYEMLEKRVEDLEQAEFELKNEIAKLRKRERHRMKPSEILSPQGDVAALNLADIVDMNSIQSIMDDFFKISDISTAIIDLDGNILAATGRQDICTRFHRAYPEICRNCPKNEIQIFNGTEQGAIRFYRCENNMWHVAAPVIVNGKCVGDLFLGQFIFSDELPEMDIFRSQARKYKFHEEEYLAALERIPCWNRETVNTAMIIFSKMTHLISELSLGNLTLTQSLMERDIFYNSLLGSERNLSITLNAIGDAVMATDDAGNIVRMNPVAERLTGWHEREAMGKPVETVFTIIRETTRKAAESPVKMALEEGVMVELAVDTLLISKNGKEIPITDSCAPIIDDYGDVTGSVLVFRDQTKERAAQKALEESQDGLRLANEMLEQRIQERTRELEKLHAQMTFQEKMASVGQLAAGIAHELNNPLNFVSMNFDTLSAYFEDIFEVLQVYRKLLTAVENMNPFLPESIAVHDRETELNLDFILNDTPALFKESGRGFERIARIIQSMRNFSYLDRTGGFTDFNINTCINDTLVIARNEYKYIADVTTDLGYLSEIRCLPEQLNQVFLNLIVNSAQAIEAISRPERGRITIRTWQDETKVYCEIADDGPGVPADIRTRIFEPFFTTKPPGQGTGLGLSICYDIIVEKHQGDLAVHCPESGGTVFSICISRNL